MFPRVGTSSQASAASVQLVLSVTAFMMIRPSTSAFVPLSPERIEAAQERHGHAVQEYLKYLRIGDVLADDVVLCFERLPAAEGRKLLQKALYQGIDSLNDPPPELVALFRQIDHVPFWVDWERMKYGNAKVLRNAFLTALAFGLYALPFGYLGTQNKALAFTKELLNDAASRYAYTSAFIIDTFLPNGLQRYEEGFMTCIRVRIGHAMVRRRIFQSGEWDSKKYGIPVNQAHMAVSSILFSFYVIEGLEKMGIHHDRKERESVLLVWRYASYLLGINPELVNTSEAEALRMIDVAFSVEFDPDETAAALCRSTIEAIPVYIQVNQNWISKHLAGFFYSLSRHLIGNELADRLAYPKSNLLQKLACRIFIAYMWLTQRVPSLNPRFLKNIVGIQFWLNNVRYH